MTTQNDSAMALWGTTDVSTDVLGSDDVAHLVVNHDKVVGAHLVPGLKMDVKEVEDGIEAIMSVEAGAVIEKPVHLCFGMLPEKGVQRIVMKVDIREKARISIMAHCTFPNAVDVKHLMEATINIGEGAEYSYFERHIHGDKGGVTVVPKAIVELQKGARFRTEFELIKGRVGKIDIDYETTCHAQSVMEMTARINGTGEDVIKISETGHLVGEGARGVLTSRIAVRDNAKAEVYNKMTASAPHARGHVDCKEIVQDNGIATAVPVVEVNDPRAHVTHEAAIGSVDSKALQTLLSRGLTEDEAVELIINGLLS